MSRVYVMRLVGDAWTIWRHDPEFSRRFEATITADRRALAGNWQKRARGDPWEHDFDLAYTRR